MNRWCWFAAGLAIGLAVLGAGSLAVIETGVFDARASTQHGPITAWATRTAMLHSMRRGALAVKPPLAFTAQQTIAGMHLYQRDCLSCHGAPGVPREDWVQGLTPSPPFLLDASRRWTRAELFWVVKNGMKMTGMPAWGVTRSDADLWDVVAFLEAMPLMKPADFQRLEKIRPAAAVQAAAPNRQAR